jgi:hypothetical protein
MFAYTRTMGSDLRPQDDPPLSAATIGAWRTALTTLPRPTDDATRWDVLRGLEELKAAAAATQAWVTVDFESSQRAEQEAAGSDVRDLGRGIAAQIGAARRESPARGARHLGLARALVHELPHTLDALATGATSEWRATLVARETACLSREDRSAADEELAQRPGGLAELGDRAVETETRAIAYRLDPVSFTRRAAKGESERRVSLRPAPDTMSLLSGLLPVRQGVAVLAALTRHAGSLMSSGDPRTRGQIMADTLVERLTGQATADAVPVEVQLVVTDATLTGNGSPEADPQTPARVPGFGPVPAPLARSWVRASGGPVWLRRLYAAPATGALVAMDSRRRLFTGQLRRFVVTRDEVCRTPWCDAPIRHVDHVRRAADGGATSADNAQGLCAACNLAREAPGWRASTVDDAVVTRLPTGHEVSSRPPVLARPSPPTRHPEATGLAEPAGALTSDARPPGRGSVLEQRLRDLLRSA